MTEHKTIYTRIKGVVSIYCGFDGYFGVRIEGNAGEIVEYSVPSGDRDYVIVSNDDIVETGQIIAYADLQEQKES